MSTVLGLDFGLRRIGIATGNTITNTASPLTTLAAVNGNPDWHGIQKIIADWRPKELLVGHPLHVDGTRQDFTDTVEAFAKALEKKTQLPVHLVDERLTSRAAETELKEQRRHGRKSKVRKEEIDAVAARLIVETWFGG